MKVIAGTSNGFGYRPDDHGNDVDSATLLEMAGGHVTGSRIIGRDDEDYFSFSLNTAQRISLKVSPAPFDPNLRPVASLFTSAGEPVTASMRRDGVDWIVSANLPAGEYRLRVAGDEIRASEPECAHVNGMRTVGQYTIGPASDSTVEFSTGTMTVNEKTKTAAIVVNRSGDLSQSATVRVSVGGGTATLGSDYDLGTSVVTLAPGETSKTITVSVNDDKVFEGNETVQLLLGDPVNAGIGEQSTAVLTIQDDDPMPPAQLPIISFSSITPVVNEGDGTVTITVNLSSASDRTITVRYATGKGKAKAPGDFSPAVGTLTFAPGHTSQSFTVQINNDSLREQNETVKLKLSKPTNAKLSNSAAVLTIVDDDSALAPAVAQRVVSVGTDKVVQKETPPVAAIDWLLRERTFPVAVIDRMLGPSELPTRLSAGTDGVASQPQGSVQDHGSSECSRDDVVVVGKWWEDVSCDLVGK